MTKTYWGTSPSVLHTLVTKAVEPLMYYAAPTLCSISSQFARLQPFQRVLRTCMLMITGCLSTTPTNSLHQLTGILSPDLAPSRSLVCCARRLLRQRWLTIDANGSVTGEYMPLSFKRAIHYELQRIRRDTQIPNPLWAPPICLSDIPLKIDIVCLTLPISSPTSLSQPQLLLP